MNKHILQIFFLFLILLSFYSCNNRRETPDGNADKIEAKLNDSLSIVIYLNEKGNTIGTMVIKNSNSKVDYVYGFRDDGVTPVLFGKERNDKREGPYYTYWWNGMLNKSVNYIDGKLEGEYDVYTDEGKMIYKAFFEHGAEKKVEINDTKPFTKSSIAPVKEEHK